MWACWACSTPSSVLATASRIYEHRIEASAHLRFLRFDVSQLFL